ncbi:hypothetical protein POTOM_047698 [Populus tomentosa]|uniref:Uncharacterized protein n=1 Tax=Populus tomentosa TaxID=118781 RepID=A0A8X7YE09_POPTO|nr:hypothetical protein POTOM_047698 [Populus tomentosa]
MLLTGDSVDKGFFRLFLHRRAVDQISEFLSIPVGEKLREKLKDISPFGIYVENAKNFLSLLCRELQTTYLKQQETKRNCICIEGTQLLGYRRS